MPIFFQPSSAFTPSAKTSSAYAHPGHATMGVLQKGPDPRSRRRKADPAAREQMRAERRAKRLKVAERRAARDAERKAAFESRRKLRSRESAEAGFLASPEAMNREVARLKTVDARKARDAAMAGGPKRLTPTEQELRMQDIRRARDERGTLAVPSQVFPLAGTPTVEEPEELPANTPLSEILGPQSWGMPSPHGSVMPRKEWRSKLLDNLSLESAPWDPDRYRSNLETLRLNFPEDYANFQFPTSEYLPLYE